MRAGGIDSAKGLAEGAAAVVTVTGNTVDQAHDGRPVNVNGQARTE